MSKVNERILLVGLAVWITLFSINGNETELIIAIIFLVGYFVRAK